MTPRRTNARTQVLYASAFLERRPMGAALKWRRPPSGSPSTQSNPAGILAKAIVGIVEATSSIQAQGYDNQPLAFVVESVISFRSSSSFFSQRHKEDTGTSPQRAVHCLTLQIVTSQQAKNIRHSPNKAPPNDTVGVNRCLRFFWSLLGIVCKVAHHPSSLFFCLLLDVPQL